MPKQRHAAAARPPARKARARPAARSISAAPERSAPVEKPFRREPAAPPRKPAFYEALALYETGVRALQRHDFEAAAASFRDVIQRYPDERELVERARLYLQVCERETARRPSGPQTPAESVYAATLALNAGDSNAALDHLNRALAQAPDNDHAHYIMAVAQTDRGDLERALGHLHQAIALNPDNRSTALQDPDLSALRELQTFREAIGTPPPLAAKRRARPRR